MFKTNNELTEAMKEILETFLSEKEISTIFPKYPDERSLDLVEAINKCIDYGYLTGVSCQVGAQDDVVINVSNPHVTASGSHFILEN